MKKREQDLPPVFERPVHAVDLKFLISVIDFDLPVTASAPKQVPGQDASRAALPAGAVGHADCAPAFRFQPHDAQAALYR